MPTFYRVSVDWKNESEEWWAAARESSDPARDLIALLLDGPEPVGGRLWLTPEEFGQVFDWAASLPGWSAGPDWAPSPLAFSYDTR